MIILGVIIAYIFIGATFGAIVNESLVTDTNIVNEVSTSVFSGIFWPIAVLIWGGYYFAIYILKKVGD